MKKWIYKTSLEALAFCLPGRGPVFRPHRGPYAVFIFSSQLISFPS